MTREWQQSYFLDELIQEAIEVLLVYEPPEGYYFSDSGGKDSTVVAWLLEMAGVRYDAHFHRSGVDPAQIIRFLKEHRPHVDLGKPESNVFELIIEQGIPPMRTLRFCCRLIKEEHGMGRRVLLGTRRAESRTRVNRQMISSCPSMGKSIINPILEWSEAEVWDFIHRYELPYCSLYDEGFKRIGCIMCPNGYWKNRIKEAERWPRVYKAYLRCFEKMLVERERKGLETTWTCAQDVMDWWLEGHRIDDNRREFPMNLNDRVRVTLTDEGSSVAQTYHTDKIHLDGIQLECQLSKLFQMFSRRIEECITGEISLVLCTECGWTVMRGHHINCSKNKPVDLCGCGRPECKYQTGAYCTVTTVLRAGELLFECPEGIDIEGIDICD